MNYFFRTTFVSLIILPAFIACGTESDDPVEVVVPDFSYKGEVFYVNKNHVDASDENGDGSLNLPWETITHGIQNINSGDALIVIGTNSGIVVYDERIISTTHNPMLPSGTQDQHTIIRAYPRRSVKMEGFFIRDASYVRIEGFQITNDLTEWDGCGIQIRSQYNEIVDNYIEGIGGQPGIKTYTDCKIIDNHVYKCQYGITVKDNCLIENNRLERMVRHTDGQDSDYIRMQGDNVIIRNNIAFGTLYEETADLGAHFDFIQQFNYEDGPGDPVTNAVIENNQVYDYFGQGVIFEDFVGVSDNVIIRNNIFAGGASTVLLIKGVSNVKIYNNLFYNSTYGIRVNNGSSVSVANNIFMNLLLESLLKQDGTIYQNEGNAYYNCARDDNNVNEPGFMNPESNDFNISSKSDFIDAGIDLPGIVDEDIDGVERPIGKGWDIGPYEKVY